MDSNNNVEQIVFEMVAKNQGALAPVEQVDAALESVQQRFETLNNRNAYGMLGGLFNEQFDYRMNTLGKLISMLSTSNQRMNSAKTYDERERAGQDFDRNYAYVHRMLDDLEKAAKLSNDVTQGFTQYGKEFEAGVTKIFPKLAKEYETFSKRYQKAHRGELLDIDDLTGMFQATTVYRDLMAEVSNFKGINEQKMNQVLRGMTPFYASKSIRKEYFGEALNNMKEILDIRDMLPASFSKVQLSRNPTLQKAQLGKSSQYLTQNELDALTRIIMSNPYIRDEAKASNILRAYNGSAYINPLTTQEHVNALAGQIATLFTAGAKGMPSARHEDWDNPDVLKKIIPKTNQAILNSKEVAKELDAEFAWLNPSHLSFEDEQLEFDPATWRLGGKIHAKPRRKTMEFKEFDIKGNPFMTKQYDPATREMVDAVSYTPVDYSLHQAKLSQVPFADQFYHNGRNGNEVFVRLPFDRLSDKKITDEERNQIREDLASLFKTGITDDGKSYGFTRFTPTHAVFTRQDLIDEIEASDPGFFSGGDTRRTFTSRKDFLKNLEYSRKNSTEGESIASLYGTDLDGVKVVVGDFSKFSDGQNWMSNRLVPEGFQGRDLDGKATFGTMNFRALANLFRSQDPRYNHVLSDGSLVIPGVGVNGGDLVIPPDTGMLENTKNIKGLERYAGLSQDEFNAQRSADVAREGVYVKTTYRDAVTEPRFIPAQIARNMQIGPEGRKYFQDLLVQELMDLEDPNMVIDKLFSGDDALSELIRDDPTLLNNNYEAIQRVASYRESLLSNVGKGAIPLPTGGANYAMISDFLPGVIAKAILAGGGELSDEQKKLLLNNDVVYLASQAEELGLFRNPGGIDGNVLAANLATDHIEEYRQQLRNIGLNTPQAEAISNAFSRKQLTDIIRKDNKDALLAIPGIGEKTADKLLKSDIRKGSIDNYFARLASMLGMDPEALYVDSMSDIMKRLQGADVDGDTALVHEIKNNDEFGNVMRKIIQDSVQRYREILDLSGRDAEDMKLIEESHTKKEELPEGKTSWSKDDPYDLADAAMGLHDRESMMGAANASGENALQVKMAARAARAVIDSSVHYDKVSNYGVKDTDTFETTDDEWEALKEGRPFAEITNWAMKSRESRRGEDGTFEDIFKQDEFNQKPIDAVNFPSVHQDSTFGNLWGKYIAHQKYGLDINDGFDWNEIFGSLPNDYDQNSARGTFVNRLRGLRNDMMQGNFFGFEDSLIRELKVLRTNAYNEMVEDVLSDNSISSKQAMSEVEKRMRAIGGNVPEHIKEYGATRENLRKYRPDIYEEMEALEKDGVSVFRGSDDNSEMAPIVDIETLLKQRIEQSQARIKELEAKKEEIKKEKAEADKLKQEEAKLQADAVSEATPDEREEFKNMSDEQLKQTLADIEESGLDMPFGFSIDEQSAEDWEANQRYIARLRKEMAQRRLLGGEEADGRTQEEKDIDAQIEAERNKIGSAQLGLQGAMEYVEGREEYNRVVTNAEQYYYEMQRRARQMRAKNNEPEMEAKDYYQSRKGFLNYQLGLLNEQMKTEIGKDNSGYLSFLQKRLEEGMAEELQAQAGSIISSGLESFKKEADDIDPSKTRADQIKQTRTDRLSKMRGYAEVLKLALGSTKDSELKKSYETQLFGEDGKGGLMAEIAEAESLLNMLNEETDERVRHENSLSEERTKLSNQRTQMQLNQSLRNLRNNYTIGTDKKEIRYARAISIQNHWANGGDDRHVPQDLLHQRSCV